MKKTITSLKNCLLLSITLHFCHCVKKTITFYCYIKIVPIFCDVKCPVCVILCIYSLHSFIENTFNFMIKILGHILTFFLGKGAYTLFDVNPHFPKNDPD